MAVKFMDYLELLINEDGNCTTEFFITGKNDKSLIYYGNDLQKVLEYKDCSVEYFNYHHVSDKVFVSLIE